MSSAKEKIALKQAKKKRRSSIAILEKKFEDPPPYSSKPPSANASIVEVNGPDASSSPELRADKLDFMPSPLELPTPAECLAHLKLLHAFAKLRHVVGNQNGYCGILLDECKTDGESETGPPEQNGPTHNEDNSRNLEDTSKKHHTSASGVRAEQIREKRWLVFVAKAVDRFHKWLNINSLVFGVSDFPLSLQTHHFESGSRYSPSTFPINGKGVTDIKMPPLDILMIWHAYMLNPRVYLEDSMREARHKLWHTGFPWEKIYRSIDDQTFEYRPGVDVVQCFEDATKMKWNAASDDSSKSLDCPKCRKNFIVPWTEPPLEANAEDTDKYLSHDRGFVGHDFQAACPHCYLSIKHENLRVAKYLSDAETLIVKRLPLPGTILSTLGLPHTVGSGKRVSTHDPFFPNRAVHELAELKPATIREELDHFSIEMLKTRFEGIMNDLSKVQQINSGQYTSSKVFKESKIAVRKMLSHYWDNSSPFGLDLVGAVIRQGTFVQKMRKIDWLHSPAAYSTMQRLIIKYHRFIRIIADNPKQIAVPTLDVDLAWVRLLHLSPCYIPLSLIMVL